MIEKRRIVGNEEGHAELPCLGCQLLGWKRVIKRGYTKGTGEHVDRIRSLVHLLPAVEIGHQTNSEKNYAKH